MILALILALVDTLRVEAVLCALLILDQVTDSWKKREPLPFMTHNARAYAQFFGGLGTVILGLLFITVDRTDAINRGTIPVATLKAIGWGCWFVSLGLVVHSSPVRKGWLYPAMGLIGGAAMAAAYWDYA